MISILKHASRNRDRFATEYQSWLLGIFVLTLLNILPLGAQKITTTEADKLNKQISDLYQEGRLAEALPLALQLAKVVKLSIGEQHPDYATILKKVAGLYKELGQYVEAESLYRRSLSIYEMSLSPDNEAVASSLSGLGMLYYEQGRYAECEPLFKRVVASLEQTLGSNHIEVARSINNLAELYATQGRYAESEPLYKRSLSIREKLFPPEHREIAVAKITLAGLYQACGRYPEAEPLYEQGLAVFEKVLGKDHPDVATCLNNLAALYVAQGRYTDAEPLLRRGLTIRERKYGPDHLGVATSLHNLASLFHEQGIYSKAEPLFRRSLLILEKVAGEDHPNLATCLNGLGSLYNSIGKYADAEPLYQRSLAIRVKSLGPDHPNVADSLNNLATLYDEQGKYTDAAPLYMRSLAIRVKSLGPDHPDVATSINNLAWLFTTQGKHAEAEILYKRSLAIQEKQLPPEHPDIANSLNNLAALYLEQGNFTNAEMLFMRSLAIREKLLGPDHPDVAVSLNNLASMYSAQADYSKAEPLFRRSLAIREKFMGSEHPDVTNALYNLALMHYAQAQYAKAAPFFERGLQNLRQRFNYSFTYMNERERLLFLSAFSYYFSSYLSFCLSSYKRLPGIKGKIYDVLLWRKGLVAQSVEALRSKVQSSGDLEVLGLLNRLTEKKNLLAKLTLAPTKLELTEEKNRKGQIEQINKEANDLERSLVTRVSSLGEEQRLAHTSWRQVRDALKLDEAAVEILCVPFHDGKKWTGSGYYIALILRRKSVEPELVVLGDQNELEKVPLSDYHRLVAPPDPTRPEGLGSKFFEAFWEPIKRKLGKAKKVYLSSDGELNTVAFGVVPDSKKRLLMDMYDLRIVNSTRELLLGELPSMLNKAVLIGNPKFELSETELHSILASAPSVKLSEGYIPDIIGLRSSDLKGSALFELPDTQQEIEDVSSLLRNEGWQVRALLGEKALEEYVKAVRGPRILHLATHGFFVENQSKKYSEWGVEKHTSVLEDPMLRSGVYLAGANRVLRGGAAAPDLEDGVLTAYEVSQMNLQGTELVVLSACETGLGKTVAGEGVFGLRRAFQVAGAEAVLMSLWSVPDKETRELMTIFYRKWLSGIEKHKALRQAQQEMREKMRFQGHQDVPFFWGAFVLVGR